MELYAGIDLHSNNSVVTVLDEQDRTVFAKRLANDLTAVPSRPCDRAWARCAAWRWSPPTTGTGWSTGCTTRATIVHLANPAARETLRRSQAQRRLQ